MAIRRIAWTSLGGKRTIISSGHSCVHGHTTCTGSTQGRRRTMPEIRVQRRLMALMSADVVGYSRLMGADEAGTLSGPKGRRATLFDALITQNRGPARKVIGAGRDMYFRNGL